MPIVIDIKTRIFDKNDKAYRLFPGQGYRYYKVMKDYSRIFLDNPGIPMPGAGGYQKDEKTLHAIVRSEVKQREVYAGSEGLPEIVKHIDARPIGNVRWSKRRSLSLSWLNTLYYDASPGDLVILPSPGFIKEGENWVFYKTLIGEIVGEPERWTQDGPLNILAGRYLVRRVKWLAEVDEADLDRDLVGTLRTQNALVAVKAQAFERALGAAYKNIVIDNEFLARFNTESADFKASESFHFGAFAMAVVAAMRQINGEGNAFSDESSIYDIAATVPSDDPYVPDQEASIHSPGYLTIRGMFLVPVVISALFALALAPDAQLFAEERIESVEVVNSESPAYDPCEVGIEESVRRSLEIIGFNRWKQMCQAAAKSNENEGLRSITSVEVPKPRPHINGGADGDGEGG